MKVCAWASVNCAEVGAMLRVIGSPSYSSTPLSLRGPVFVPYLSLAQYFDPVMGLLSSLISVIAVLSGMNFARVVRPTGPMPMSERTSV